MSCCVRKDAVDVDGFVDLNAEDDVDAASVTTVGSVSDMFETDEGKFCLSALNPIFTILYGR